MSKISKATIYGFYVKKSINFISLSDFELEKLLYWKQNFRSAVKTPFMCPKAHIEKKVAEKTSFVSLSDLELLVFWQKSSGMLSKLQSNWLY